MGLKAPRMESDLPHDPFANEVLGCAVFNFFIVEKAVHQNCVNVFCCELHNHGFCLASNSAHRFISASAVSLSSKNLGGYTRISGEDFLYICMAAKSVEVFAAKALPSSPARNSTHPARQCVVSHLCQSLMSSAFG